jgi:hypothetical protein
LVIRYDDYKLFGSETGITFGGIVDETSGKETQEKPTEPPDNEQPQTEPQP